LRVKSQLLDTFLWLGNLEKVGVKTFRYSDLLWGPHILIAQLVSRKLNSIFRIFGQSPRLAEVAQPVPSKGGSGERPAEDSAVRNRVGGQDSIGPFAGSNPALGTTQHLIQDYASARNKYRPDKVCLLLIAESPPSSGGYFYAEVTIGKDHLFRETMKALEFWPINHPMRKGCDKRPMLAQFRSMGFFLIDTCELPVDKLSPEERRISTVQGALTLPKRVKELDPCRILIVKKTVFKPVKQVLSNEGFGDRILNVRPLPFPSHGNQKKFRMMLRRLVRSDYIGNGGTGRSWAHSTS
jgi:hypothetical protein